MNIVEIIRNSRPRQILKIAGLIVIAIVIVAFFIRVKTSLEGRP
jgi:hypothetical protein